MATVEEWLALGDRLYAKGVDVFNGSEVMESEAGTRDPKVVALTLLARTLGHFQAAVQLLGSKHVGRVADAYALLLGESVLDRGAFEEERRVREGYGA